MITITPSTGAVKFDFDGNQYYLNDGSISYPLNSLSLVIDDSDIVSFKNQAGDIVLGCHLDELGKSKAEMEALYESSFVGGAGVTPEDVEEMIDEAVSGKQDISGMTAYTLTSTTDSLSGTVTGHTSDQTIHVTAADKTNWDAKVDQEQLDSRLGGCSIVALTQAQYDALATKDSHTLYIITA